MKKEEIERKYLASIPSIETLAGCNYTFIMQGYISDGDERVRFRGNEFTYTVKTGTGLARLEDENEITEDEFWQMWPLSEGKRIFKIRYEIPFHGNVIELDYYLGRLEGLITAEIELKHEKDKLKLPDWFKEELTFDPRYKNKNLAQYGLPA